MKKAIVSGANGFVGSAVVKELVKHGIQVTALYGKKGVANIPESQMITPVPFDLKHATELTERLVDRNYDIFYHFAWTGSAGADRADTLMQLKNVQWNVDAMRVAKALGCKRFVNAGTIMEKEAMRAVFQAGNRPGLGYIYGSGKLAAHAMCKSVASDIDIELIWAMITNAYGVGERSPRMVNTTIKKCIRGERPQFTAGTQNYDFVYIDDVARAFRLIGEKGRPFCEYMIGSGNVRPLKEWLLEMQEAIAPELGFVFGDIPFTGVDLPSADFDCSDTEEDTGFSARISFYEGCKMTRDWLLSIGEEDK